MKTAIIKFFAIIALTVIVQGCVAYAPGGYPGYGYGGYGPGYYQPAVGIGFAPAWGFRGGWGRGWGHGRR